MLDTLQGYLKGIKLGDVSSVGEKLRPILSNDILFGVNLYEVGLGEKIEGMFKELIQGPGAVRATLVKYVKNA
jgi:fructuronate reductase